MLPKPAPLEQLEGFVLNAAKGSRSLGLMGRCSGVPNGISVEIRTRRTSRSHASLRPGLRSSRHAGNTAIGSAPVLEGMPPAGS